MVIKNDRLIVIISGLPYSGKSTILEQLRALPEYREATIFSQDRVSRILYENREDRDISMAEHRFKNEWMRYEILRALVSGARILLVDSVMLTKQHHQRPMLDTISRAREYINAIRKERQDGSQDARILVKVILCFAMPEIIETRLQSSDSKNRRKQNLGPIFDLQGLRRAYEHFEFPDESTYKPLYIETSDDSEEGRLERMSAITQFIQRDVIDCGRNEASKRKAIESHRILLEKIHTIM